MTSDGENEDKKNTAGSTLQTFQDSILSSGLKTKPGNPGRTERTLSQSRGFVESILCQGGCGSDIP